jgi:hypothetical protein
MIFQAARHVDDTVFIIEMADACFTGLQAKYTALEALRPDKEDVISWNTKAQVTVTHTGTGKQIAGFADVAINQTGITLRAKTPAVTANDKESTRYFDPELYRLVSSPAISDLAEAGAFFLNAQNYTTPTLVKDAVKGNKTLLAEVDKHFAAPGAQDDTTPVFTELSTEEIIRLVEAHTDVKVNPQNTVLLDELNIMLNYTEQTICSRQQVLGSGYATLQVNRANLSAVLHEMGVLLADEPSDIGEMDDNDLFEAVEHIRNNEQHGKAYTISESTFEKDDVVMTFESWLH